MLHYDGKLYIGGKLGDVACFTVLSHWIKDVKIVFLFLVGGGNEKSSFNRNSFVAARYVELVTAYTPYPMLRKSPDKKWSTRFVEILRKYFNSKSEKVKKFSEFSGKC